jgi:transcriptional regulator with GAF, ATPase, and Fis domain
MSVLDDFRDAEQRVAQRLKELEPTVAEYRELQEVARRLGIDAPNGATQPTRPARRRRAEKAARSAPTRSAAAASTPARKPRSSRRSNAASGQRGEQLLALVRERPGVTVAEAGKALGVDPTGLYRVVSRLEARGELRKNGRSLEPAGAGSSS